MKNALAFCPGHITGFFSISKSAVNPLESGSLGAGFSISKGVYTRATIDYSKDFGIQIMINESTREDANVSKKVIAIFFEKLKIVIPGFLNIEHQQEVPEGSGFGSSGAGALSLALALNKLFSSPLSLVECAQIAHIAELDCNTGLGTVMGETYGGLEIRIKAGAPGYGELKHFHSDEALTACIFLFGSLKTEKALQDQKLKKRIQNAGTKSYQTLEKQANYQTFMKLSRQFSDELNLYSNDAKELQKQLDEENIHNSMLMFGDGLFTLLPTTQKKTVFNFIEKTDINAELIVSSIDILGARIMYED